MAKIEGVECRSFPVGRWPYPPFMLKVKHNQCGLTEALAQV
jgi:hypothetical protein